MPPQRGEEEHPRWHRSCWLGSLHAEWVVVLRPPIRYIMADLVHHGGIMRCSGGVKEGGLGAGGDYSHSM